MSMMTVCELSNIFSFTIIPPTINRIVLINLFSLLSNNLHQAFLDKFDSYTFKTDYVT